MKFKKFRKRPIVVEAIVWDGRNETFIEINKATDRTVVAVGDILYIHTLEGMHKAQIGDYIIKGVEGELYPCKPGIFRKTYEEVEDG